MITYDIIDHKTRQQSKIVVVGKFLSVVHRDARVGANPDVSFFILCNMADIGLNKAFVCPKMIKE
jgi:hypothetical protein